MTDLTAADIKLGDIGRTVRSLTYRDKNKTSKPIGTREYIISSIYAHENGNILINGGTYLRANTPIAFTDEAQGEEISVYDLGQDHVGCVFFGPVMTAEGVYMPDNQQMIITSLEIDYKNPGLVILNGTHRLNMDDTITLF